MAEINIYQNPGQSLANIYKGLPVNAILALSSPKHRL